MRSTQVDPGGEGMPSWLAGQGVLWKRQERFSKKTINIIS